MESEICLRCNGTKGMHYLNQKCMQFSCTCPKFESSKCQFCHNTVTKLEAYDMEKYGEPHCDLAQFPNKVLTN